VTQQELLKDGFLGTAAPFYADIVLLLEIGMGLGLVIGAVLARSRRYKSHALCQCVVVLLNLVIILIVMIPGFASSVIPKIPARLAKSYYWLASVHALLGLTAEIMAVYILVAAGTRALPARLRLRNYKVWMRTTLLLWWSALLLGIATYVRWYVPH
jgi:uncharacterized membrane protein YozB (DUF420 family)